MTRLLVRIVLLGLLLCATAVLARAASATFWTVATQAEFLKGHATNLAIDRDGRLTLGPAIEQIAETSAPVLWAIVPAKPGGKPGEYFVGSGNEGKVLRVDADGGVSVFFDAGELEVHAMAAAPDGGLYVGTSPDGKVYRLSAKGESKVLFDPDDKYIWALATDARGALYVATGDKGVIYRVTPDGQGTPFYRTRATHAMALAFDRDGRLLAGTGSPGRVFRIDPNGKGFVLLDSPHREIRALRIAGDGSIYAAALSDQPASSGGDTSNDRVEEEAPPAPTPSVSTEITAITIVDASQATATAMPARESRARQERGAIYRILPDGVSDSVWSTEQDLPYDLAMGSQGNILVATGGEGRLFQTSPSSMSATLLGRVGAQQVTSIFAPGNGEYLFATANPGKLFRLSASRAGRGTYESDVRDATTVASWGTISWRGQPNGGRIEISTRTGNTATPDDTWSDWSPAYDNPEGDTIVSPKARYLQWRAVLTGGKGDGSPVLTSVTTAYLPRNLRPEVESITVHPAGTVFQKPFSTGEFEIAGFEESADDRRQNAALNQTPAPMLGRRMYQKGLQTLVWKAEDPNGDDLVYDVLYRREGDTTWRTLRRGLSDPIVVWDTTSVPDGTYVVRIAANDALSNSPGTALAGERESTSFEIDNTPPRIVAAGSPRDGGRLRFTVRDDHSPIKRVEYSLEGERWRMVYPTDGIPDSRVEEFQIDLAGNAGRSVTIRATDAMNNAATVSELKIEKPQEN